MAVSTRPLTPEKAEQPSSAANPTVKIIQSHTEQPDQYQLRDLRAQEDMAFWAMGMFVAAIATFAITSIGTILIWRQVRLTRHAVQEAIAGTEATREASEIAREIGQAQARCYMSAKNVTFRINTFAIPNISMNALNSGQSPARNFRWTFQVRVKVMPNGWEWESQPTEPSGARDVAAQQNEPLLLGIADGHPISQGDLSDLELGPDVLINVRILAVWNDVFGTEWQETWLFQSLAPTGLDVEVPLFPDFAGQP